MMIRGMVALCLSAWAVAPAEAATFYYVSDVYDFANVHGEAPLFAVGEMTIDESKLPAGQALSGLEFYASLDNENRMGPDYFSLRLSQNSGEVFYDSEGPQSGFGMGTGGGQFTFDEQGTPSYWDFAENSLSGTFFSGWNGDGSLANWAEHEADIDADWFLTGLGYKPGTRTFNELKASHTWANGYSSQSGGAWYSDALEFASAVARRTMQAMQSSISNIYSIPSCRVADAVLSTEDYAPPIAA